MTFINHITAAWLNRQYRMTLHGLLASGDREEVITKAHELTGHGTRAPKEWIEDKNSLTPKMALSESNVERRRAACEIIGWAKILEQLKAKTIDKNIDEQIGELLEVNLPDSGKEKFLRVRCGTGRQFAIPVPPDMKTALQANAWTWGLQPMEYKPEIRT